LDPDPVVRGTDPRIRIRTEMSRIPNSGPKAHSLPGIGELIEDGLLQHGRQIIRVGSAQVSEKLIS
jgi:hypothetical protein